MFSHAAEFSSILMSIRGRKKDETPEQLIKRPLGLNKNYFHPETESIRMSKHYVGWTAARQKSQMHTQGPMKITIMSIIKVAPESC